MMSEIDDIKAVIEEAQDTLQSAAVTTGGVLNSETDLVLYDGKTIGERLPGGLSSLTGNYAISAVGEVVKES